MFRNFRCFHPVLLMALSLLSMSAFGAQIEVAGKHTRADGSIYDFQVVDGDALSPGDRFQIILNADKTLYYAILYFSRDGEPAQIFPPAGKVGVVKSGQQRYIPGVDNYFTLDINGGRELMFIVTSPNGLSNLKSVLRGVAPIAVQGSSAEIDAYLKKRLAHVQKLEITNTGKRIATTTDQISSSLSRDIAAIYARNPWPATTAADAYEQERVRRGEDNTIPEAVRQRASEVRSLLKRPRGTTGSSSLRTVQVSPSESSAPATGSIRRSSDEVESLKKQQADYAEAEKRRKQQLAEEERRRQQEIEAARLAKVQAEEEARRLQTEREEAELLEAQRIAEAEAKAKELEAQRIAMQEAEAEARRQAALRAEQERKAEEEQRIEEERLARVRADQEAKRIAEEKAEAERKEAERLALQKARDEEESARLQAEAQRRAEEARAREQERLAAEQARLEEEQRLAAQMAAEAARQQDAERLAAEEEARLEEERLALAAAEAEAIRLEQERLRAEEERQKKAEAEAEARQLAELRAAEEAQKQAEEARRQAEIAAEDARIRAEQEALEKEVNQQLAEKEATGSDDKQESSGLLDKVLAFVGSDEKEEKTVTEDRAVVEVDSTGEVILNEGPAPSAVEYNTEAAQAPPQTVVVLEAEERPIAKPLTAPAPQRVAVVDSQASARPVSRDSYARVASAIVSISTSNDPQASGFILDNKGHILTGWHVINGVNDIDVSFMAISGAPRSYKAKVVKYDKFRDLALLKLIDAPEGIQPITVAPNELPDAGSTVRVFGQKDGKVWATDDAVITRIAPHFTWFSRDNVIHRGEVLQVDIPAEGREIGSLVTTMDYQLLGVKSFSGSQTGRTYAVSVRMIRDFVASRGKVQAKAGQ